jgi:hypothetical protein
LAGTYFDRTATALFAFPNLVLDLLVFIKRCSALSSDFRMMEKQIVSAIVGNNKTVSFPVAEPFYSTCTHVFFSLSRFIGPVMQNPRLLLGVHPPEIPAYSLSDTPLNQKTKQK